MSETGLEVRVHRTLLGLYTEQWRQNLQGLGSTELVFILQGVGHQELEELVTDIYKPCFDTGEDEQALDGTDEDKEKYKRELKKFKQMNDRLLECLVNSIDHNKKKGSMALESCFGATTDVFENGSARLALKRLDD